VADLPESPDDLALNEVEQAFFESAPPEEPGPAVEPVRFDDLEPAEPPRRQAPAALQRARAAASAARASLARNFQDAAGRASPALASARRNLTRAVAAGARRSAAGLVTAREITLRAVRAGAARLLAARSARRVGGQGLALTLAGLILVMGLSAGVVASRNGTRTISTVVPAAAATAPARLAGVATPAPAPPVEPAAEPPAPSPPPPAAADPRPPRTEAAKRPARGHRKAAAPSRRADIMIPTFMQAGPTAPQPARRPVFSR